jgi:hypothetical protein
METTQQQEKKPKEQLHELMVEMFGMIEEMDINEGKYLEFAEMFKQMNLNLNRITEIKNIIVENVYYQRYVKRNTTIKRKRLTEAQKAQHTDYILCGCGCYIHKDEHLNHINTTLKHRQGIRNKKYSVKYENPDDPRIDFEINREIVVQGFCIKHYSNTSGRRVDEDSTPV